jgi:hypothetical protein
MDISRHIYWVLPCNRLNGRDGVYSTNHGRTIPLVKFSQVYRKTKSCTHYTERILGSANSPPGVHKES